MARTMKERIIEYLQTIDPITQHRRVFGITFDKVTVLRRSMQVTMIIIMVDGQLTPIYLESPSEMGPVRFQTEPNRTEPSRNRFGLNFFKN